MMLIQLITYRQEISFGIGSHSDLRLLLCISYYRSECLHALMKSHCGWVAVDLSSSQRFFDAIVFDAIVDGSIRFLSVQFMLVKISTATAVCDLATYLHSDALAKSCVSKVTVCLAVLLEMNSVCWLVTQTLLLSQAVSRLDSGSETLVGLPVYLFNRLQSVGVQCRSTAGLFDVEIRPRNVTASGVYILFLGDS